MPGVLVVIPNVVRLANGDLEVCSGFDVVFWLGDLNYRIELRHSKVKGWSILADSRIGALDRSFLAGAPWRGCVVADSATADSWFKLASISQIVVIVAVIADSGAAGRAPPGGALRKRPAAGGAEAAGRVCGLPRGPHRLLSHIQGVHSIELCLLRLPPILGA